MIKNAFKTKTKVSAISARKDLKIAVIVNCMGFGIARSLEFLLSGSSCDVMMPKKIGAQLMAERGFAERFVKAYDFYIIRQSVIDLLKMHGVQIDAAKMIKIEPFFFNAYHPDTLLLNTQKGRFKGNSLKGIHSSLIYKAYKQGFSKQQTLDLFNEKTFAKLGWFEQWDYEKALLLQTFKNIGINLENYVEKWSRREPFMLLYNHPRIECLFDIVREIVKRMNVPKHYVNANYNGICPIPDNLKNASIYPVYPEIAESYGVSGNYSFKANGKSSMIGLQQFIGSNIRIYQKYEAAGVDFSILYEPPAAGNIDEYLRNYR